MAGSATVLVHEIEITDLDRSIDIHRVALDVNGEVIEDAPDYDWTYEVHGDGRLTVYAVGVDPFTFNPLNIAPNVLTALS